MGYVVPDCKLLWGTAFNLHAHAPLTLTIQIRGYLLLRSEAQHPFLFLVERISQIMTLADCGRQRSTPFPARLLLASEAQAVSYSR